ADLRALELPVRVLRQRQPEAVGIGAGSHVVAVGVVGIGDPVAGHGVVRGQQHILGSLAGGPHHVAGIIVFHLAGSGEVGRHAGLGGVALGLDGQVAHVLVAVLDAILEEEAVAHGVVGHVVVDLQVVRAVHGHAAVVRVVNGGILDVLALG